MGDRAPWMRSMMEGGVQPALEQNYWEELGDSLLTLPWSCPNSRVHLT